MKFRNRLLLMFTVTIVLIVATVAIATSIAIRRAYERADEQHTAALVAQVRNEIVNRGEEVTRAVEAIAARESTQRMAAAAGQSNPDFAGNVNDAEPLARSYGLDFLEFTSADATIISSAQWPARFGDKDETFDRSTDKSALSAFLRREEVAAGNLLALSAVRAVRVGGGTIYVIGGRSVDRTFLATLAVPAGMRVLLYSSDGQNSTLSTSTGQVEDAARMMPLVRLAIQRKQESSAIVYRDSNPANSEAVHALPLLSPHGEVLAVVLAANSRADVIGLERGVRWMALMVGVIGVMLGVGVSAWAGARIAQPVQQLADAARQVSAGNLDIRLDIPSGDELGDLADAFDRMTHDIIDHRERLVQSERVAAWRELARRLAHELKNPLFPMQLTVENLIRAREIAPDQFEEVFQEGTSTLLQEIANMKAIIARFSDFSKMPKPQFRAVQVNEIASRVAKLVEPQLKRDGADINAAVDLSPTVPTVDADADLLYRAIHNLVLNAIDAMPKGGTLTLRSRITDGVVRLDVGDTGSGLAPEEQERIFTPYYTTKQHGTGLGLAIVQSIISDHHGKVWVESEAGRGTTFHIELPATSVHAAQEAHV